MVRGKNYAQLILYDRDGNERMPFVQEGKMCQYLISFAAVKGVTTALGSDTMFIDEALEQHRLIIHKDGTNHTKYCRERNTSYFSVTE